MAKEYVVAGKKITRESFEAILAEMEIKDATELELCGCELDIKDLYYAFQGFKSFITALRIKEKAYDNFVNSSSIVLENTLFPKATLNEDDIKFITGIVERNSTITELGFGYEYGVAVASSNNSLIKDGALTCLLEFLQTNRTIKNLKLVASFFNEKNAALLQGLLSSNKVLTDLDLSECNLDAPLLEKIRDGLSNNNSLTTLYLHYLDRGAAKIIADILVQNRLKRLSVENSYFDTEDAKTILAAVKGTKLEYLSMGGVNHTIDTGIDETLAETVRGNQKLRYLSISSIKDDTGVFTQFAFSLAENNALEELDFSYGNVGDGFLNAITKTNLRVLKLQDDEVTAGGLEHLMGRTTKLEELCVSSEELRDLGNKLTFFKKLAENIPTLKHIDTGCEVFVAEAPINNLLTLEQVEEQVTADSEVYSYGGINPHVDRLKLQEQREFCL